MELNKKIEEVKNNYETLDKATNDDGEFVIIAEKDEGGSYEEYKECLGVNSKYELIWSYLSGCSCNGSNENEVVSDITSKTFRIDSDKNAEDFYNANKCEPYKTSYCTY